jgi:hypothetical protein
MTNSDPASRPLVTLDTNALIALRHEEPAAPAVRELLDMNRAGLITILVTLSTGLERQRAADPVDWWPDYIERLESLGIEKGNIFSSARTVGFATPGAPNTITFDPCMESAFNHRIHAILFPTLPFSLQDYLAQEAEKQGIPLRAMAEYNAAETYIYIPPTPQSPTRRPTPTSDALNPEQQERVRVLHARCVRVWDNAKGDALGLHAHITHVWHTTRRELSVFVTSDRNFLKPAKIAAIRALGFPGQILPPAEAVTFLREARQPLRSA